MSVKGYNMSDDFLADLAKEAANLTNTPSDDGLARLRKQGEHMVDLEATVARLEDELKKANVELWELKTRGLPDLLTETGMRGFELLDGTELRVHPYYKANIAADWDQEKKDAAYQHLDDIGGGDIVKNTITISFPKGWDAEMREWMDKVRGLNFSFDPPPIENTRTVPWNTLTAFVKELVEKGTEGLDLEKLGATVGQIVKTQKRKQ